MSTNKLIKETGLSDKEMKELKEAYVKKYAIENGLDYDNLTNEQLNEIRSQEGYKQAGLLLS